MNSGLTKNYLKLSESCSSLGLRRRKLWQKDNWHFSMKDFPLFSPLRWCLPWSTFRPSRRRISPDSSPSRNLNQWSLRKKSRTSTMTLKSKLKIPRLYTWSTTLSCREMCSKIVTLSWKKRVTEETPIRPQLMKSWTRWRGKWIFPYLPGQAVVCWDKHSATKMTSLRTTWETVPSPSNP